jgi:hypothetical protein
MVAAVVAEAVVVTAEWAVLAAVPARWAWLMAQWEDQGQAQ